PLLPGPRRRAVHRGRLSQVLGRRGEFRRLASSRGDRGRSTGCMDSGLYIAASGMLAEMVRQEQISHQLANVNTPGFKPDRATQAGFGELLLQNTETGASVGRLSLGVEIAETSTDLAPAGIHETGEAFDFAVEGEGFFAVRTEAGVRYTRNGQFSTH